jgi:hypothetical protein
MIWKGSERRECDLLRDAVPDCDRRQRKTTMNLSIVGDLTETRTEHVLCKSEKRHRQIVRFQSEGILRPEHVSI